MVKNDSQIEKANQNTITNIYCSINKFKKNVNSNFYYIGLVVNISMVVWPISDLVKLYTLLTLKKNCTFLNFFKFLKFSILIILYFCHFSFTKLFLNIARYTLSARSGNHFLTKHTFLFKLTNFPFWSNFK